MKAQKPFLPPDLRRLSISTPYGPFTLHSAPSYTRPEVPIFLRTVHGLYCARAIAPYTAPSVPEVDGIPVYLPAMKRYGCWDANITEALYLYPPFTTWEEITHNIVYYTSFLSTPEDHTFSDARRGIDLSQFTFVPHNLLAQMEATYQLTAPEQEQRLVGLIATNKHLVAEYVAAPELLEVYAAFAEMHKALAQTILRNRPNASYEALAREIIPCYERCLPVLDIYRRNELVPDGRILMVLILLTFWYADINRPRQALHYAQQYLLYHPAGAAVYQELRMLVHNRAQ